MNSSLIIDALDPRGKKLQKTLTYIHPNATNAKLETFAQKLMALTTNTYQGATRVKREDVTDPDYTGKPVPTLTLTASGTGSFAIAYSGDGELKTTNGTIEGTTLSGVTAAGVVYASETENFAAAIAEFSV